MKYNLFFSSVLVACPGILQLNWAKVLFCFFVFKKKLFNLDISQWQMEKRIKYRRFLHSNSIINNICTIVQLKK